MAKNLKNLIMIALIVIGLVSIYFTTNKALESKKMNHYGRDFMLENREDMQIKQNGNGKGYQVKPEEPPEKLEGEKNDEIEKQFNNRENFQENREEIGFDRKYIILFSVESLVVSLIFTYLVMSKFNEKNFKETFQNIDKIVIYILLTIIIVGLIITIENYLVNQEKYDRKAPMEEKSEKTTSAEDVESGKDVIERNINLNDYNSNITLTNGGEYTLTGSFEHSILINSDTEVILNLENVNINNEITAAIANISTNSLIINLKENTTNVLSDGGSSEYDACIYSAGPLTISGDGKLEVYGKQEEGEGIATETNDITINAGNIYIESNDDGINAGGDGGTITINGGTILIKASGDGIDSNKDLIINGGTIYTIGSPIGGDAGIDTDDGFDINGGLIVALGSDMLEKPNTTSKQNSLCFTLDSAIENGTVITLVNENDEVIISFEAMEKFRTLIISSDLLKEEKYYLYKDGVNSGTLENGIYQNGEYEKGEKIIIKNSSEFSTSGVVTSI